MLNTITALNIRTHCTITVFILQFEQVESTFKMFVFQLIIVRHFIAQSLLLSPFHRIDMTGIMFKGTYNTNLSLFQNVPAVGHKEQTKTRCPFSDF